ncbi:hypothetical protein MCOR28_000903 [Pyricularia oryzae]|nr:hypothetical protein MCOR26_002667 [Pyricularia oryzae]KAI6349551.1 hypothetical protein MCOR28_000903 [Pyricularia oryzae]KAI6565982.1 hypothetical protein MCOR09_006607 [Pyricularia oryzae]
MSYVRVNSPGSRPRASLDDSPPPPYSETDVFSTSGPRTPLTSEFPGSVVGSVQDTQSTTGGSTSTESREVVYTPPLTPTSPSVHQSSTGSDAMSFSSSLLSAAAYFESRPATVVSPGPGSQVLHTVTVAPDATPDDMPYPPSLAGRDVSAEDWHTFVNFLLPDHSVRANEAVADRKLRAEGGGRSVGYGGSSSSSTSTAHAEAQLEQILTPGTSVCDGGVRRDQAERTVREWNEGFFAPRGVAIVPQFSHDDHLSPWESASASRSSRGRAAQDARDARGSSRQTDTLDTETPASTPHRRGHHDHQAREEQPDIGGLGLRFGTLNLGALQVDSSGIRFDGRPLLPGLTALNARGRGARHGFGRGRGGGRGNGLSRGAFFPLPPPPPLSLPRWQHNAGGSSSSSSESTLTPTGTPLWSPGAAAVAPVMLPRGFYEPAPPHKHADEEHHEGGGGQRGRGHGGHDDKAAAAAHGSGSRSRSSSVASASSASSADSIESLPPYEDLADEQIPVARDLLRRWLDSPGQAITRESARVMNEEIRSAGSRSVPVECRRARGRQQGVGEEEAQQSGARGRGGEQTTQDRQPRQQQGRRVCGGMSGWGRALPSAEELAVLRREVQEMSTQWKAAKHAQRRSWREERRERRERRRDRRAEWRERREAKREVRSAKRALKREARDLRWGRRREGGPLGGGGGGGGGGLFGFGRLVMPILQPPHLQYVPPTPFSHCCGHEKRTIEL